MGYLSVACLGLAIAGALLYRWSVRREPRRLRLGVCLVAVLWSILAAATSLLAALVPQLGPWPLVALVPLPASVLVLAGFMVVGAVKMARRQGTSLRSFRLALLGVTLLALPVVGVLLAGSHVGVLLALATLAFVVSFYLGVAFVCFFTYAVVYDRLPARANPSAVVVLGTKLENGRIPPLLQERLDQGIVQWQRQAVLGHRPLLVPSGGAGVGPDALASEGAAMAEYLVAHGIPTEQVVAETAARTTQENLGLSQQVAFSRGREGSLTVVTSDYHVARTSLLAQRAGLDADVVGSRTTHDVLPRVFLREFFTVLTFNPWVHAVLVPPAVALCVLLARAL